MDNTTAAAKNAAASARILALIATGMNPVDACKAVLGIERIDAMIETVYNTLRAEVAQ